jgi:hypothetical protein
MAENSTNFTNDRKGMGRRPKGSLNRTTVEARELAQRFIEDVDYQACLRKRLIAGKAPHIETLLFHYAYGKPAEHHEIRDYAKAAEGVRMGDSSSRREEEYPEYPIVMVNGVRTTPEGRERIRTLAEGLIQKYRNGQLDLELPAQPSIDTTSSESAETRNNGEAPHA